MKLNLRFPPTPEYAEQHAEIMVQAAKEISGAELDFSPASLNAVDEIIEQMRQDGDTVEQIAETLFGFGCYVGEVFVRNKDAKWRLTEETPMKDFAGVPMVVELGPEQICNPIGKVFKRLENGKVDNLPYFYYVFTKGDDVPAVPAAPRQKPSFWRRIFGGSYLP